MRVLIDECEWQQQQYKLILVKIEMMNIKAANNVSTQSYKPYSNISTSKYYFNIIIIIIYLSFIKQQ